MTIPGETALQRRRGSKNSQAKGLEFDNTLESHLIGTDEAIPFRDHLSGNKTEAYRLHGAPLFAPAEEFA